MAKFRFGVCTLPENAAIAAAAGCDFIESGFAMVTSLEEGAYRKALADVKAAGLPVLAMNSMLPGQFRLYGDAADREAVLQFVRRGLERAAALETGVVVFGSGSARRIPDGMERKEAENRLRELLHIFCEAAKPYGIRMAIEPLRAEETNWLHTVSEAAALIEPLPSALSCGINPDSYHMVAAKESFSVLSLFRDKIHHLHISAPDRYYPLPGNADNDGILSAFLRAVDAADGCRDVSIEGITRDFSGDVRTALPYLNRLANAL